MKDITISKMIDFIVKAQSGFKIKRNTEEYISRYNSLSRKSKEEIIKLYKEI